MSSYRIALGSGVALGSLVDIVPQPTTDAPAQPVQRNESASGLVHEIGLWTPLQWNSIKSVAQYQTLLDQFDLDDNLTRQVTVYLPNHEYVWTRYNAIAVRPQQGRDIRRTTYFIRDVTIILKSLVAL